MTAPKAAVRTVRLTEEHAGAVAEFFRAVWDPAATPQAVSEARAAAARENWVEIGADIPTFGFLSDDKLLGYIATIPTRLWNGREEYPAHWMKGFMVLPEHRGGPVGYMVLKEALKHLDLAGVMTVAPPSKRLFAALGFQDYGALGNHITVLRPGRVAARLDVDALGIGGLPAWLPRAVKLAQRSGLAALGGGLGGVALGAYRALRSLGAGGVQLTNGMPQRAELDALWRLTRVSLPAAAVRDGAYVPWHYGGEHHGGKVGSYAVAALRDRDGLAAIAVVRQPREEGDERLRGIRVASLSDILYDPRRTDVGLAALAAAEGLARGFDADALLCTASHPALTALLPRRAYLRLPGNVHFMLRDPGKRRGFPTELPAWWLTRGDASSDESF